MANKKISALDPLNTAPAGTDILPITDVSGTPTTKRVTVANLMLAAPVQSVDSTNVEAAGALMDSEVTNLAQVKAFDASAYATSAQGLLADSAIQSADLGTAATTDASAYATSAQGSTADTAVQPAGIANMVETTDSIDVLADVDTSTVSPTDGQALVWDNTAGQWEPGPAGASTLDDLSDVTITSAQTEDVIKYNGSTFVNGQVSVDVDTPLTTALRGTDNPHIGAYPNQSFKVTDNPNKSVMVLADADGNLEFMTKDGANVFVNTPSSRLALAKGFSIQADGAEPDIEAVDTDGTTYSVISGDTDTKGANGLPTRQGFNLPDIGANPAPILISGGTIA